MGEQRLFRLLAVFAGGYTLEAVEEVSGLSGGESEQVVEGVSSLLKKHLLYQQAQPQGEPRLEMLETFREYGLECLVSCDELEKARQAHAIYYLRLAERAEAHLFDAEETYWLDRLEREHDNLRAALHWLLEPIGEEEATQRGAMPFRLTEALVRSWTVRWSGDEARIWLEQALERGVNASVLA